MARTVRPAPEPLDVDGVGAVTAGTLVWFVLFCATLLFHGRLEDAGHGRWPEICLAGVALGLVGIWYCRRRRDAIHRDAGSEGSSS